jgi:NADH-quinone oxidoreductase subunit N
VDADDTWLGVAIAVGTMISLAYYLRVVAAVWMRPSAERAAAEPAPMPAIAGGSHEADPDEIPLASDDAPRRHAQGPRCRTIIALTALAAAATVFFGVIPSPLVDWAANAGEALASSLPS